MALSNQERQAAYRKKIRHGELWRVQVIIDEQTHHRFKALCKALGSNRTELITRLLNEEWNRRDQLTAV